MINHWFPDSDRECPPLELLEYFSLGKLSSDAFETISEHAAICSKCETVLEELEGKSDSFTSSIKRHLALVTPEAVGEDSLSPDNKLDRKWLGRYELLELLGEGGMGIVYRARQDRPRRHVAVKVANNKYWLQEDVLERLRNEVEAIGRLQHPNIVQVYEYAEEEGCPYFAMEFISGGNLGQKLKKAPLGEREAAELVRALAGAVQAAHNLGVIHRDLKPENVLIGRDGAPKLADFGLAKLIAEVERSVQLTQTGAIIGTASYMAPEQARGDTDAIGPLTDVYGLGAILYEALTGQPPFRGKNRGAILSQVTVDAPQAPSSLQSVSRVIEAICLKCLEKDPARRYQSAQDLADDLDCWLKGLPTIARPPRWWVRNRWALLKGLGAALLVGLLLGGLCAAIYLNPDRPRQLLESALNQKQSVEVLPGTGTPPYYRIWLGDEGTKATVMPDGTFSVATWELCLIELIPDSIQESFRYQVEIRHEKSDPVGFVGIYFCDRFVQGIDFPVHNFGKMTYNDIYSASDIASHIQAHARDKLIAPKENRVILGVCVGGKKNNEPFLPCAGLTSGAPFIPGGNSGGIWRSLSINVSPAGIDGYVNGQAVGVMSANAMTKKFTEFLKYVQSKSPDDPFLREMNPTFSARGGLGLLLSRGSASFRFAVVTPLIEQQ